MIAASSDPTGLGQICLSESSYLECLQHLYHVETQLVLLDPCQHCQLSVVFGGLSFSFKGRRQEEDEK